MSHFLSTFQDEIKLMKTFLGIVKCGTISCCLPYCTSGSIDLWYFFILRTSSSTSA